MQKSKICQDIISGMVSQYQSDLQAVYSIQNDLGAANAGLRSMEVAKIIYPSIMLLVDSEARALGFEGSNASFKIEKPRNPITFPLLCGEPQSSLISLLPFVVDVCDRYLAEEKILANVFEQAIRTVIPTFTLAQAAQLVPTEDFRLPSFN
jgi:hypothetical protein